MSYNNKMTLSNKKITGSIYDSCGNISGFVSKMDKSYTESYYSNNFSNKSSITYISPNTSSIQSSSKSIKKNNSY